MTGNSFSLAALKDTIQDSNVSFLVGAGLSVPFLSLLGNIEGLLTDVDQADLPDSTKELIRASLYKRYCDEVIFKNLSVLDTDPAAEGVLENYKEFLRLINTILLNRRNPILNKQVNIFTTNIDIFFEKALEALDLEYVDGFSGRFQPFFSLSNFRKSTFTKSLHFDNTAEIPVFNLFKLHGSLTWEVCGAAAEKLRFTPTLGPVRGLQDTPHNAVTPATQGQDLANLVAAVKGKRSSRATESFMEAYQKLPIINPTKEKFETTLLNQTHYELLRMYANALEKENSTLFVMGFSFADEHIQKITLRAANSNPTLTIFIIAHSAAARTHYAECLDIEHLKNRNIKIITPETGPEEGAAEKFYDFATINEEIFGELVKMIEDASTPRA